MSDQDLKNRIYALELELASSSARCDHERLDAILREDFIEFGASGRRFTKPEIVELLTTEEDFTPYTLEEFEVKPLGTDTLLATYRIPPRPGPEGDVKPGSRRSSIWQHSGEQWQIIFHQGTRTVS